MPYVRTAAGTRLHYQVTGRPGAPPILIGHSWGAMLATAYLGQYPDEVRAEFWTVWTIARMFQGER